MGNRYTELAAFFAGLSDPDDRTDGLELLQQYADLASDYYAAVCRMETAVLTLRFQMDADAYRKTATERDRNRTSCHDALIAATRALNRYLKLLGMEPFYPGDEQDRYAVAAFAGEVLQEIYSARSRGLNTASGS